MTRFIVAIDKNRGLADNHGIPWQGKIPGDVEYFRKMTEGFSILMGKGTYNEFKVPLPNRRNFVATSSPESLRKGFQSVSDPRSFLRQSREDVWVIGGAKLFKSTIDLTDELYITQIDGDWHCTKFFPEFKDKFKLKSETTKQTENGVAYCFTIWKRLPKQG